MKSASMAAAAVLMACSALAFAHTHLVKSVPADGSTVTVSPPNITLTFAEPAKLTALSIQKDAEPARKLGPFPTTAAAEISVVAPKLVAGKYVLSYRVVSDDGHVMPGKVTFTVSPAATKTSSDGTANTVRDGAASKVWDGAAAARTLAGP